MNLIFFGAPGVGKGTQAALLAERLKVPHISTGAIFRAAIDSGKILGLSVKRYMDDGLLVPDDLTTKVALDALDEPECANGFILDGYPRNLAQARALDEALKKKGRKIDQVIHLTANEDELIDRMLNRGRPDDTEAVIRRRQEVYHKNTEPVLDYYLEQGIVTVVDGLGTIPEVHERICASIGHQPA